MGLGYKWHEFFEGLEYHDGLDINNDAHMWLLHFLFLDALNEEITAWANGWNTHIMSLRGQRNQTPAHLFYFGCISQGLRGTHPSHPTLPEEPLDDPEGYGIDWQELEDNQLVDHHHHHNPEEEDLAGVLDQPAYNLRLNQVEVPEYDCPLTDAQVLQLKQSLGDADTNSMVARRHTWRRGFQVCREMARVLL
jgi:hypothetical protein